MFLPDCPVVHSPRANAKFSASMAHPSQSLATVSPAGFRLELLVATGRVLKSWVAWLIAAVILSHPAALLAQQTPLKPAEKANLLLPDLGQATFFGGLIDGRSLLLYGLIVVALGLLFGLVMYSQLKNLPVHKSMLEISELIYATCKTYLITQIKFLVVLEAFIGAVIVFYFGYLQHFAPIKVLIILLFSIVGICGSSGVAWFGIRVNTFANSRAAFASLRGQTLSLLRHSPEGWHEHRYVVDPALSWPSCSLFCCSFRTIIQGPALSASRLVNPSARRLSAWLAEFSPRSPISVPT